LTDNQRRLLVATSTWPLSPKDHRAPFVRNLTLDLAKRGWGIEVLAPHAAGAPREEVDGSLTVRRFRYVVPERFQTLAYGAGGLINFRSPARKLQAICFVIAEIIAIRHAIRRFKPHLVHAHWLLPQGFAAGVVARHHGVPLVTTIHGGDVFGLNSSLFRPFKRAAIGMASAITCNGTATYRAAKVLGAESGRITEIRFPPSFENEIDPTKVAMWRNRFPVDAKIILFVGRLIPEKGPADFIEAIARTNHPGIHGVICGDGPMRTELQLLVERSNLADRIAFEGWLDPSEVACRMAGADALLFPSKTSVEGGVEGQGIVPLEAMRVGLPVFAARSGGIPDLVREGVTGWLFDEADTVAMSRLIRARAEGSINNLDAIVDRAKRFVRDEFTREKTAGKFHALFLDVISAAPNHLQENRST
jgi:glycosyltransferase involved in cell wall biosynthesis